MIPSLSEEKLTLHLKQLMKLNLKNMCYRDAIFFADKLLHIQQMGTLDYCQAVYDLAHCFLLNKEYSRCVQLIEKNELVF